MAQAKAWTPGILFLLALAPARGDDLSSQLPPPGSNVPWHFVPLVSAMVTRDDNVFISSADPKSDTYFQFAPSLAVGVGDFRTDILPFADIPHLLAQTGAEERPQRDFAYIDYTPDFELFSRYHGENTVNEDVRAAGRWVTDRTNILGDFRVQSMTSPDIDVGNRIHQVYDTADVTGTYAATGKINVGAEAFGQISRFSGGFSSNEARLTGFADYQATGKTSVGIGAGVGALWVSGEPTQDYQRLLGRWNTVLSGKLTFRGDIGAEFRQFRGGFGSEVRPVFDAAATYDAAEGTAFTAGAVRQSLASALYGDADIDQTTVQAGVRQRLPAEFYGKLQIGYVQDRYYEVVPSTIGISRRDDFVSGRVSLARDLTRHGTIEAAYEHRHNASTVSDFGFSENLASLEATFLF